MAIEWEKEQKTEGSRRVRQIKGETNSSPSLSPPPSSLIHTLSAGPIHSKVISNPIGFPWSSQFSRDAANILKAETSGRNSYQVTQHSLSSCLTLRQDEGVPSVHGYFFHLFHPFLFCLWDILVFHFQGSVHSHTRYESWLHDQYWCICIKLWTIPHSLAIMS